MRIIEEGVLGRLSSGRSGHAAESLTVAAEADTQCARAAVPGGRMPQGDSRK